jgi:hypothetical protein
MAEKDRTAERLLAFQDDCGLGDLFTVNTEGLRRLGATESSDSQIRSLSGEDRFVEKFRTGENLDPQGVR